MENRLNAIVLGQFSMVLLPWHVNYHSSLEILFHTHTAHARALRELFLNTAIQFRQISRSILSTNKFSQQATRRDWNM